MIRGFGLVAAWWISMFGSGAAGTPVMERGRCSSGDAVVTLEVDEDVAVRASYSLRVGTQSLKLGLPAGQPWGTRANVDEGSIDSQGVVHLESPSRQFSLVIDPGIAPPPRPATYPLAFAVEGRGTGFYLPYLLPSGCEDAEVRLRGGTGIAAVADGSYRSVDGATYMVRDKAGFVLLGHDLIEDSILQLPKSLPAWLARAIALSYANADRQLQELLGMSPLEVVVLVDFEEVGVEGESRSGGDVAGDGCTMRLWFRGKAWQSDDPLLRARMNEVVVHELAHCYQKSEIWEPWAHEGHARFIEIILIGRRGADDFQRARIEERFGRDFDRCMNDLRIGESSIDPYSCGSVAYWLRWMETGRVDMLTKEAAESLHERRTVAARFLRRTADESEIVDFIRGAGVGIEVVDGEIEPVEWVRSRLIMTLLRQSCKGVESFGYWMSERSVRLHAPMCPEFNGIELLAIAGHDIVEDALVGYVSVGERCKSYGMVVGTGIDGEEKLFRCDRSYEWPSSSRSLYRLAGAFDGAGVRE